MLAAWLVASMFGAPEPCSLEGIGQAWEVTVAPDPATTFDVRLSGARAEVTLMPEGARVRVVSPLAFEASAALTDVPLGVARATWITPLVFASTKTWLAPRTLREDGVEVALDLGDEVRVEPVAVPCVSLALRPAERDPVEVEVGLVTFRGTVLPLQRAPDRGEVFSLVLASPDALSLHELGQRKGWVRVEARWTDGTKIRGWTPADALERDPYRMGRITGFGRGICQLGARRTLPTGTAIHSAPDGPRWATVTTPTSAEIDASVPGWWRVVRMPGLGTADLCDQLEHVWARANPRP